VSDLFGRNVRYETRAAEAIRKAENDWDNIEDIINALEWGLMHAPDLGPLLNERGLRGFVFPGARSRNEPDIDVLYEFDDRDITIHDLTFRQAKAHYAGQS
jgi:hypothetical protein